MQIYIRDIFVPPINNRVELERRAVISVGTSSRSCGLRDIPELHSQFFLSEDSSARLWCLRLGRNSDLAECNILGL